MNSSKPNLLNAIAPEQTDALEIAVRAYVHPETIKEWRDRPASVHPSSMTLTFDTETTADEAHTFRFGAYHWRDGATLIEAGLFYDPDVLDAKEVAVLNAHAEANGLRVMTVAQFSDDIFYGLAYDCGATIVGFNLPFDISRIAIDHGAARRKMRGGFTFKLTTDKRRPNVQIKHLSQRTSFIRFTAPYVQRTPRGMRKRGLRAAIEQGSFVDVKTLAGAMLSESFTLERLSSKSCLNVPHPKLETNAHGATLTDKYVEYAVRDVLTTWECYDDLTRRYAAFGLTASADRIYSEASLGKCYLDDMGIQPWRKVQPNFPPQLLGYIMATYYGGRSEIRIRRHIAQVLYCDFVSMYPSVCTLMGLWRFVIAKGMTWRDGTAEIREFLARVTLADLQDPATWRSLAAIVRLRPDAMLVPVRAPYEGEAQATIGLNFLTATQPLWYTLADCIVHKLLSGTAPAIEEALIFKPEPIQDGLKPVAISGNPDYLVDPVTGDFYRQMIDLRRKVQDKKNALPKGHTDRTALDIEQHALKIAANSTSYGIFVEINVEESEKLHTMICEGPSGKPFAIQTHNVEQPGAYFHPLLGTLITGAARLMLAILERLTMDHGLEWAMCDTDSMAIAKPNTMPEAEFYARGERICAWFEALNPYTKKGSLLKVEDVNADLTDPSKRRALYCLNISAKRYAFFNIDADKKPIIRAASAHGVGLYRAPYSDKGAAPGIPAPKVELSELGVEHWQHDLWYQIVSAALQGQPEKVDLRFHPALDEPAVSHYAATTPKLLKWFDAFNRNRPYGRQVRPFGFLLSLFAKAWSAKPDVGDGSPDRRKRSHQIRPVAPFHRDNAKAARMAFDRLTGASIGIGSLKTYRQVFAQYHMHPETKFLNADYADKGVAQRRHIFAADVRHIGKEANQWERQFFTGLDDEAEIDYGAAPDDPTALLVEADRVASRASRRSLAKAANISERHLHGLIANKRTLTQKIATRIRGAIDALRKAERNKTGLV